MKTGTANGKKYRSNFMIVATERFNERFFLSCQMIKQPKYRDQQIFISGWSVCENCKITNRNDKADIDITGIVMTALDAPPLDEYITIINEREQLNLPIDGSVSIQFIMEIRYRYRGK